MRDGAIEDSAQDAVADFLSDQRQWAISLSGTGAVRRLEQKFAVLLEKPHALAVSSATMGLWAVFVCLRIKDQEVVTTPYTWGGSLAGLLLSGNRPVFADIDAGSLTLDPDKVRRRITAKTKAILAVDIYGHPSHGEVLRQIADKHRLWLIQDCAQSFGAYVAGHHTGFWADASIFSFTFGKALFAGEGGMIVTGRQELFEELIRRTQHPLRQRRDAPTSSLNEFAMNLRVNPLAAVWAEAIFDKALERVAHHRRACLRLLKCLEHEGVSKPGITSYGNQYEPSFHALTVAPSCGAETLYRFIKARGWPCSVERSSILLPVYQHQAYREFFQSNKWRRTPRCRVTERQCMQRLRIVGLPAL